MRTSTTVGSTNVSSLFRQTPDLISPLLLLILGKSFFSFSEGFLSISHRRPSITVWQNGPNNHVHPNSPHLSPPSLENVPNRPDAKVPVCLSSPIVLKGNCWKKERKKRGSSLLKCNLLSPSSFRLVSLSSVSCVNARVFRAACHAWLFINLTNCAESVSVCVCGKNSGLVGETERWTDASSQWMAGCGPFCFTVFGLEQNFWFDFARAWQLQAEKMIASVSLSNTHTPREREKKEPYPIEADGLYSVYNSPLVSWQLLRPSGSRFSST